MLLSLPPPVMPMSVWAASPGPLTTHPIIERVIGVLIWDSFSSKILTVSITGEASQTQIGLTGGGKDSHMMYISGLPHHKLASENIIEEVVALVENKSKELQKN